MTGAFSVVVHDEVIDAPPQEVWRVIADPRNLPRWNQHIRAVHGVPDAGLEKDARYWTEIRVMGVRIEVSAIVEAIDPPHSSVIRLGGPLDAVVRTRVRPIGHARSRLRHEVEYRIKGGPVGALISRAVKVLGAPTILKRGVRAQKDQIEHG